MKVVSINAEKTVGFKQIALNVDEELTPEFVSKINYGNLKFSFTENVLVVHIPVDDDFPFNAENVKSLNQKLQEVGDEFSASAARHQNMLTTISRNTGLPLG